MTALRYALLAALVLTASACDSGDDEVRRAFITQISIIDAPTLRDNGDRWDGGVFPSGPDIFLEVEGTNGTILLNTRDIVYEDGSRGVSTDADALSFPVTFPVPDIPEAEFDDLNRILRVELRDDDGINGSESMLFTDQFTFDEFAPTTAGSRTNIRVESADRTALVQITVDWEN